MLLSALILLSFPTVVVVAVIQLAVALNTSSFHISHETEGMSREGCVQQTRNTCNLEKFYNKKCFCLVADESLKVL